MNVKIDLVGTESTANVLTEPFHGQISPDTLIWDTTLREGEQPPGVVFSVDEKFEIARSLDELGVKGVTVGFPAVSRDEMLACQRITKAGFKMKTGAMARMVDDDIKASVDAGVDVVGVFFGGSDTHLRDKMHMTEAEALSRIEKGLQCAKDSGLELFFAVEDASRTPLPRLVRMFQLAADAGASCLIFADTAGVLTPSTTGQIIEILAPLFTAPIGLHFHNDLGLALGNTLAGLEAGARMVQATVNGAGERAGNTCLEELAVVLKVKYGIDFGFRLERLNELCTLVHKASGTRPSAHKAITGKWCFSHESGIHVAGVLANPECYQPYPPAMIGRHHEIIFGKHSGGQGLNYLAERAGISLSDATRKDVLQRIKLHAEKKQGIVEQETVLAWIREANGRGA